MKKVQHGFTLIELMIVIAIIGILASVALPAYQKYTAKAAFSEVKLAAKSVKSSIDVCFQTFGQYTIANCNDPAVAGFNLINAADATVVNDVAVDAVAVVTATAIAAGPYGINSETYVLTPAIAPTGTALVWGEGGSCRVAGYC